MTYTITNNAQFNSIEISFDGKPCEEIRNALKALRFRWHAVKRVWYGYAEESAVKAAINGEAVQKAQNATKTPNTAKTAAVKAASVIDLSGLDKNVKNAYGAEFAKVLREDLKRRGVTGVTIRASKSTYTDCITATVTLSADDFRSSEEAAARDGWKMFFQAEHYGVMVNDVFYHSNGANNIICGSRWDDDSKESNANILRDYWRDRINRLSSFSVHRNERENYPELTDAAYNRLFAIFRIINSYNWNHSDSQTDYFDVGFYLDIDIKKPKDFTPREKMNEEERAKVYADEKAEEEAWEAECARMEEERKAEEAARLARETQEAKDRAEIMEDITVEDLEENQQFFIYGLSSGIGKECSIEELKSCANSRTDAYITRRVIFHSEDALAKFSKMLLHDWEFVAGKGGTGTNDSRVNNDNIHKLNREQLDSVKFFANDCIAVYLADVLQFVINPEGYNYARYCYIPNTDTVEATPEDTAETIRAEEQTEKPGFYFPAPVVEQAERLTVGEIITVYQADDMILNVLNTVSGTLEAVKPGTYAQYSGVYLTVKSRRKKKPFTIFCTDSDVVRKTVVFPGYSLPLPEWVKYKGIRETETAKTCFVRNNDDQLRQIIKFYAENGIDPVFNTIKR